MKPEYEVLLAGSGGQGLVFMASFLAEAAIEAGKNVVQTQSYGIAQRGGFISGQVLIDSGEILYQQVVNPDIIVALHDCVGTRYDAETVPVLYDSSLIQKKDKANWLGLPFTQMAQDMGKPKAANLIALGAMIAVLPVVPLDAAKAAAIRKFAPGVAESNVQAIESGFEAAGIFK